MWEAGLEGRGCGTWRNVESEGTLGRAAREPVAAGPDSLEEGSYLGDHEHTVESEPLVLEGGDLNPLTLEDKQLQGVAVRAGTLGSGVKVTGRGGQGLLGTQLAAGEARLTEWVRVLGWGTFTAAQEASPEVGGLEDSHSLDLECCLVHSSFCLRIVTEGIRVTGPPEPESRPRPRRRGW